MPHFKSFYLVFCLMFTALMFATPTVAEVSCKGWNEHGFFFRVTTADITRCLQVGADINARDEFGNTPLHRAARYNKNPAVITVLVKAGAEINARDISGNTPLYDATWNNNPAVISALLKAGADTSARNKRGKTPLQFAMETRKKKPAVINALKRASERNRGREAERRRRAKSCAKWNTEAFFEHASVADVSRCLKTKNPNARNRQRETPLHKAVVYNKIPAVVALLLKAGAGVNTQDTYGNTPLYDAAGYSKNPAVITALLKAGANVNARTPKTEYKGGETPLHNAARNENPAVTEALLKAGAEINARTPKTEYGGGEIPLHKAARNKNPAVIAALLKAGAEVNARTNKEAFQGGKTPLHFAAKYNNNLAVIAAFLSAGADPNARDKSGNTPLHGAASFNKNPAVIAALVKAGANLKARATGAVSGLTPLHVAATFNENPAVITTLVKSGADPNARDESGSTPLHDAATRPSENPAIISALVKAGADPNTRDKSGDTPLHDAARFTEIPAVIAALLKAGADVNARTPERFINRETSMGGGETPLHYAASHNDKNPAIITALVAHGADVNAKTYKTSFSRGETPLEIARKKNKPAFIAAFSAEAVAAFREKERKAAAAARKREMEQRLLAARVSCGKWNTSGFFKQAGEKDVARCLGGGSEPNARNRYGETPLHMAAKFGKAPAVIAALKKAGANLKAKDKKDRTPLHTAAVFSKAPAVVTALIEAGADLGARDARGRTPLQFAQKFSKTPAVVAVLRKATPPEKTEDAAPKRQAGRRTGTARVSCEKWNTPSFFRSADAADLSRCLKVKKSYARNKYGRTPLHYAAQGEAHALVSALVKAGAKVNARDKRGGWTPLHLAAQTGKTPGVVTALIKAGADPAAKDKKGRTPLQLAEKFNKTPAVVAALKQARVESGASVKTEVQVSCEKWNTPAFFKNAGLADLTRCLKVKNPNARNENGRTPLHYAAQGVAPALVSALVKAGAKVNARDTRGGWTPLHLAAWFGKTPAVVAALLSAGADPAARDKAGKTPWDYAEQNAALKDSAPYWRLNEERFR